MPIIIYESISPMSEKEIESTLKASLTQLNWIGLPKSSAPFFGSVSNSSFRVMRVVKGRDSFNPMLYGRFHSSNKGTHVKILMTYHPLAWLFMLTWTFYLGYFVLQTQDNPLIVLLMMAFPWIIGVPLFYSNAAKSKKLLQRRLHLINIQ